MKLFRILGILICFWLISGSVMAQIYQGRVHSRFYKEYKAPSKAVLKETLRLEKEIISKGAVIAELISHELQEQIDEQDLRTRDCQKQYDQVMDWQQQPEMIQAQRSYQQCLEQYEYIEKRYSASEKLFEAGVVSRDSYESDQRAYEHARLLLLQSEQTLKMISEKASDQEKGYLYLKLLSEQKKLQDLMNKKVSLKIALPFTGYVQKNDAKCFYEGCEFEQGDTVFTFFDIEHLDVIIPIDEHDKAQLAIGSKCTVTSYVVPETFEGRLESFKWIAKTTEQWGPAQYQAVIRVAIDKNILLQHNLVGTLAQVDFKI